MNADESLSNMLAQKEALDKLTALYTRAGELMAAKGLQTLGETGPEGDALATEIAQAEADLAALEGETPAA
jgi:hypothetical protein